MNQPLLLLSFVISSFFFSFEKDFKFSVVTTENLYGSANTITRPEKVLALTDPDPGIHIKINIRRRNCPSGECQCGIGFRCGGKMTTTAPDGSEYDWGGWDSYVRPNFKKGEWKINGEQTVFSINFLEPVYDDNGNPATTFTEGEDWVIPVWRNQTDGPYYITLQAGTYNFNYSSNPNGRVDFYVLGITR